MRDAPEEDQTPISEAPKLKSSLPKGGVSSSSTHSMDSLVSGVRHAYIYINTYIVRVHYSGLASTDLNSVHSICRCTICASQLVSNKLRQV
jgi:hypothetical protein